MLFYKNKDKLNLSSEKLELLKETYLDFTVSGALLNKDKKAELIKINQELAKLAPLFAQNVRKSLNVFELIIENKEDLKGLPDFLVQKAKDLAKSKKLEEKWVFTLDAPCYTNFLKFSENRKARKKMYMAYTKNATQEPYDNKPIILKILKLRNKKSQILGFKNFAELILKRRMAKNPENVLNFLNKLLANYKKSSSKRTSRFKRFC